MSKNVSEKFKLLSKKVKQQNVKLTIIEESVAQEIRIVPDIVYYNVPINILKESNKVIAKKIVYSFDGDLFSTIMQQIEITIKNVQRVKDKKVNFQYGILVDGQVEYIDMGDYYIKDVEDDKNKEELVVTGYDNMINFMKPFKQSDLQLSYPCKMSQLVNRIGEVCGVEIYSMDFYNADLVVEEDFFTSQQLTYRDVLERIAQATLTTIFIKENKLYLCGLKGVVETLDTSYLSNLVIGQKIGPVNALVLGRGSVEDNIEAKDDKSIQKNGRCEIRFDENEFLDNQRAKVIDNMLEEIKGTEYYEIEASNLGIFWLEPCDVILCKDREENEYKTIYLKARVTITTGISGEFENRAPEIVTTKYKVTTKEEKKRLQVERLAKKNEGIIQDLVKEQTDFSEKITKHTQDINSILNEVKRIYDFRRVITGQNELLLEDALQTNLLKFRAKAKTIKGLYPGKKLFPSKKLFPKRGGTTITFVVGRTSRRVSPSPILPGKKLFPSKKLFPRSNGYYKKEYSFYISNPLRHFNNVNDEFVIEVNDKGYCDVKIIRKIKYENGDITILDEPKIELLDEIQIPLYKGDNYVYIKEFKDWELEATYIFNNELNKEYAPRVETNALIKALSDEISLEVSKKTDREALIASINLIPGQIRMEGYTSINGAFKVDEKGNVSIANDAVNINEKGIQMADGTSIVNANGLYSNLQYISSGLLGEDFGGQFSPLGVLADFTNGVNFYKHDLVIDTYIPNNFIVVNAVISIIHSPVRWTGYDAVTGKDYDVKGSSKNVHVYISKSNYSFNLTQGGGANTPDINDLLEIDKALGENGYSFKNDANGSIEEIKSINIADSLKKGFQKIIIRTTDEANNVMESSQKTGLAYAVLNITGYLSKN